MPSIDLLTMKPKRVQGIELVNSLGESEGYTGVAVSTTASNHESVFVFGNESVVPTDHHSAQPARGHQVEGAVSRAEAEEKLRRYSRVLNRAELELMLVRLPIALGLVPQTRHGDRFCAGLLGFPNGLWLNLYITFYCDVD